MKTTETKFTPGPWEIALYDSSAKVVRTSQHPPQSIALVTGTNALITEANARLISAAPDYAFASMRVLAAFEQLPQEVRDSLSNDFCNVIGLLESAHAKATS